MTTRAFLAAVSILSLAAGTGFAFANDADDEGTDDQSYQQQSDAPDHSMTDQGYSQRWFSSTGYGPNDDQADETRELNRQALTADHEGSTAGSDMDDDEDIQGPSDDAAPADADDDGDAEGPDAD